MLDNMRVLQKASNWMPFVFLVVVGSSISNVNANECAPLQLPNKILTVSKIYDGDTLKLEDGRKLRLIGVNTPERGRDGSTDQPFYTEAKNHLQKILAAHQYNIKIIIGQDSRDRYKRVLAHVFTTKGENLNASLVKNGMGFHITIPPNLQFNKCYKEAEKYAQQQKLGLWSHKFSQAISARTITDSNRGFQQVTGTVQRVGESHSSIWLNLEKQFALRVLKKDLVHFKNYTPQTLLNKRVTARGWVYKRKNQFRMALRHPDALKIHSTD